MSEPPDHVGTPPEQERPPAAVSARAAALVGVEHLERYRRRDAEGLDGTADVEAAVDAFRQAMTASREEPRLTPAYAYNLAIALQSRYDAVGAVHGHEGDLREAVAILDEAITATGDPRHPYAATVRYGLGSA